jgi:hypothetical protein
MGVKLVSASAGSVEIVAPTTASNYTATMPAVTGNVVIDSATQTLTNKTLTSPTISGTPVMGASVITSGTAVASTSGTSIDFTGIPSWVKRITVMFSGVSTNGTSNYQIQIGSGSVTTSGYVSGSAYNSVQTSITSGYLVAASVAASDVISGTMVLTLLGSNNWTATGTNNANGAATRLCAGVGSLSGALDRVRITTVNGTDTFDLGSINILYE